MKVRVAITSGDAVPGTARALINTLIASSERNGMAWARFVIPDIPKSVNHQYITTRRGVRLHPQMQAFRSIVLASMGPIRFKWKPRGVTAAVLIYESPLWITKERKIRKMDADNRVKAVFDAIEKASGAEDQRIWEFHVFKAVSKRTQVTVFLFDLGDIVDYYQG